MRLHRVDDAFASAAHRVTEATGNFRAFLVAVAVIAVWLITGPVAGWSDTWQLIINTGTTIVTFLMVFVIQHAQNREMRAVQLKLDELISTSKASDRLIDIEDLSESELEALYQRYRRLAQSAAHETPAEAAEANAAEAADVAATGKFTPSETGGAGSNGQHGTRGQLDDPRL